MPIYEYRCKDVNCLHKFEALVRNREEELELEHGFCPKCQGDIEKVISVSSFTIEGAS